MNLVIQGRGQREPERVLGDVRTRGRHLRIEGERAMERAREARARRDLRCSVCFAKVPRADALDSSARCDRCAP